MNNLFLRRLTLTLGFLCIATAVQAERFNGFDVTDSLIPKNEIVSGGPPRDGIPAINSPNFIKPKDARFLDSDSRILGIEINGIAKAYPIAILNWHEVVNDQIGSQNFTVTYCPLCGTGMVFAANIADTRLVFGVSGLLYNSDMLLYDLNTESLWSQIMRTAISGPLINTQLPQLPAVHTTWQRWLEKYPETVVLSKQTGFKRNYKRSPYAGYERSRSLYFDVANKAPNDYHPKTLVVGVDVNGTYKAYPFSELEAAGLERFKDEIDGKQVTVVWDGSANSAQLFDADNKEIPTSLVYWFAWYTFHPETAVFKAPKKKS